LLDIYSCAIEDFKIINENSGKPKKHNMTNAVKKRPSSTALVLGKNYCLFVAIKQQICSKKIKAISFKIKVQPGS
jgi:hypothetical protein